MVWSHIQDRTVFGGFAMLLYGQYAMLYFASIYILGFRGRRSRMSVTNKRLVVVNTSLFAISTVQCITYFLFGILISAPSVAEMTEREANIENVLFTVTTNMTTVAACIADSLLIWRCFVIWGRRRIVIVAPIFLLSAGTVAGLIGMGGWARSTGDVMTRKHLPELTLLSNLVQASSITFYAASFATNVIITSLIGFKIWWDTRDARRLLGKDHARGLRRAMLIIIESGSIYSLTLLLSVVFDNALPNNPLPQNLLSAVMSQVVGIFPTAITVLVGLGATAEKAMTVDPSLGKLSFVRPVQRDLESQTTESPANRSTFEVRRVSISAPNSLCTNEVENIPNEKEKL